MTESRKPDPDAVRTARRGSERMKKSNHAITMAKTLFLVVVLLVFAGRHCIAEEQIDRGTEVPCDGISVEEILDNMKEAVGRITTFRGLMEVEVVLQDEPLLQQYRMWYAEGDRSRLEWNDAQGSAIIKTCDGTVTWFYIEDEQKAFVQKTTAGDGVLDLFRVMRDPHRYHRFTCKGVDVIRERSVYVLALEPRDYRTNSRTAWYVDAETWFLLGTRSDTDGIINRVSFKDAEINPPLDPSIFTFVPPEGVQVIDFDTVPKS